MQKYAVYVRVSTDRDEQVASVENQIDICRNWLERSGYQWDEESVYKDEGVSGKLLLTGLPFKLYWKSLNRRKSIWLFLNPFLVWLVI